MHGHALLSLSHQPCITHTSTYSVFSLGDDAINENGNNDDSEEDNEEDTNKMPPKIKTKIPSKTKKGDDAELNKVTAATSKLKVTVPNKPFSLSIMDAYMVKYYTHKFVDYAEVEFFVPGNLPLHGYQVKLSSDGMAMIWKRAIPDYFCEAKRMRIMLMIPE